MAQKICAGYSSQMMMPTYRRMVGEGNLLWQFFCRFDVARDLHFDENRSRLAWDATAPIPSNTGPHPVRRWPGVTLHDTEVETKVDAWMKENNL